MDDTDRQLISLLRDNARLSVVELARKLRVARATVQNRIARLEREGTIVGYTVRLRPEGEQHGIRAMMSIAIDGHHGEQVLRLLRGHPQVVALHTTNGLLARGRFLRSHGEVTFRALRMFLRAPQPRA